MKVISSVWGDSVEIDEVEVHVSEDGHNRAAIARRADGLFCIYAHCKLPRAALTGLRLVPGGNLADTWRDDHTPLEFLYRDCNPRDGIYGTLDDARSEVRRILGASESDPT